MLHGGVLHPLMFKDLALPVRDHASLVHLIPLFLTEEIFQMAPKQVNIAIIGGLLFCHSLP